MEIKTVQHDGIRNYFGGRNLIRDSTSPVFAVDLHDALCYIGQARINITILRPSAYAGFAQADMSFLDIMPQGTIGYGQLDESVLMD